MTIKALTKNALNMPFTFKAPKLKSYLLLFTILMLVNQACKDKSEETSAQADLPAKEALPEIKEGSNMGHILENATMGAYKRVSLKLNPMQKEHQLLNMRDHLDAVQNIVALLSEEKYDEASKIAYTRLGSTTEMKLMCASFGDADFEKLGLAFHKSADAMSEVFKSGDKNKSLKALSNTMNYCVQCHATYRQ